ncbi:MAG: hypothetical protein HC804_01155 [Anaerolineae bacterium]|nr:hypothetical protein [Anaerolineae bacterium]
MILLPILIPLLGAGVALLLRKQRPYQAAWALGCMLTSSTVSVLLLWDVWQTGAPLVWQSGGWPAPFGITLVGDLLALFLW